MKKPQGMDCNSQYCNSASHTCKKLLVPTCNSMKLDRCLMFGLYVDRDGRKKPMRVPECLYSWPMKGGSDEGN